MHPSRAKCSARHASVAQLVEQWTENPRVVGSIPTGGTKYADVAHLVERHLAKVEVASSSLVIRSISNNLHWEVVFIFLIGAGYEARTRYLHLGKVALYQMS